MNIPPTISDVAKAAGVDKSTVSRVLNGKAAQFRITPPTQERVRATARQLDYHRNPATRFPVNAVAHPAQPISLPPQTQQRQIGLILSADSPAATLTMIPGVEPVLSSADYRLVIVTLPTDPSTARTKIFRLMRECSGLLCCSSIYPSVRTMLNTAVQTAPTETTQKRLIVLWQGAAQTMLNELSGVSSTIDAPAPIAKPNQPKPEDTSPKAEPVAVKPAPL
jgi:DNA-binding LacI/PurR family transcriptional regulator